MVGSAASCSVFRQSELNQCGTFPGHIYCDVLDPTVKQRPCRKISGIKYKFKFFLSLPYMPSAPLESVVGFFFVVVVSTLLTCTLDS